MKREFDWAINTFLILPLIFIQYHILNINISEDKSFGMVGVLVLFSFNQFFFQRRNLIYTTKTLIWFYIFGIVSSLFISYTYFYIKSDLIVFLVLFQIYFLFMILVKTSIPRKETEIDEEEISKKWYQRILASKTQQKNNKEFLIDFLFFMVFIIILLLIKNKVF
jgi:hypothetical protein